MSGGKTKPAHVVAHGDATKAIDALHNGPMVSVPADYADMADSLVLMLRKIDRNCCVAYGAEESLRKLIVEWEAFQRAQFSAAMARAVTMNEREWS